MKFDKLKRLVDSARPITYGIVQAGPEFEGGIPYIRPADMTDETGVKDFGSIKHTSPEIAQQYRRSAVKTGDLVISIGPSFGKVMEVPSELDGANLTQGTARVAPGMNLHARFAFWCLRSLHCYSQWEAGIGGATFRALNLGPLAETRVPNPDLPTQRAIADFLDRETARIDLLIEKKQRLAALLGEKVVTFREAHIQNSNQTRIKFVANYITSGSRDWGDLYSDKGELFVRIGNVSGEGIDLDLRNRTYVELGDRTEGLRTRLRFGDLLVSITADLGSVAVVCKEAEGAYINQHLALVRLEQTLVEPRYVAHALCTRAASDQFLLRGYGGTKQGLSLRDVAEIAIPIPDRDVQVRSALLIDKYMSRHRDANAKINKSVDRLKEYRSTLITAAVTGQISVAEWGKSGTNERQLDAIQAEIEH